MALVAWRIGSIRILAVNGARVAAGHLRTDAECPVTIEITPTNPSLISSFRNITSPFSPSVFASACRIVGDDNEQHKQKSKSLKTVEIFRITYEYGTFENVQITYDFSSLPKFKVATFFCRIGCVIEGMNQKMELGWGWQKKWSAFYKKIWNCLSLLCLLLGVMYPSLCNMLLQSHAVPFLYW